MSKHRITKPKIKSGFPKLTGKSLTTKDTKYTKGKKSPNSFCFSFVTVVSFVFEKRAPVKNSRALKSNLLLFQRVEQNRSRLKHSKFKIFLME